MTPAQLSPEQNAEREALLRTALESYFATISRVAEFLSAVAPDLASPHQEQLMKLRRRLEFQTTPETLLESQEILERELAAIAEKAAELRDGKIDDLERISLILAQADDALSIRKHGCADQLRHFTREMDMTCAPEQLGQLRDFVETVQQESDRLFARLQAEMDKFRANLTTAEAASSDPVTGLPNLREFARQIVARLGRTTVFCLLIFDLQGLVRVDPAFAEEILKQVAAELGSQVRARDLACRWEDGKFLVLLDCGLAEATARARQIALGLTGHYRAEVDGREAIAELKAWVGLAERRPEDELHQLLQRAETSLGSSQA
jgi:diguanylate cyclase (GGDEF)-like protein